MSIPASKETATKLLEQIALVEPFYRDESGKIFLKFDRIDFDPYPSSHLIFFWQGKESMRIQVEGHNPYNALTISGIEGRTEVKLTQ